MSNIAYEVAYIASLSFEKEFHPDYCYITKPEVPQPTTAPTKTEQIWERNIIQ